MPFILSLLITSLNFKVSKVNIRVGESLLLPASLDDPNVWLNINDEWVHQEPAIILRYPISPSLI